MNIPQCQIEALTAFGYTQSEARFLYIVAMHSGYFTARQFLVFVDAKRGYRTHVFVNRNWPTFDHPIWHTPLVNQLRAPGRSVVLRRP